MKKELCRSSALSDEGHPDVSESAQSQLSKALERV